MLNITNYSVQFSSSVVSDSLWPHELQHTRPPCPSPNPRVYSNLSSSSQWCHPTISSSVIPFSSLPPIPPSIRVFSNESTLHVRLPKYWSFSINPSSNEHPGLISFRMDWLDLLAVQGTLKSLFQQFKSINFSALSFLHSPTLTSIHDHWKNHSLHLTLIIREMQIKAMRYQFTLVGMANINEFTNKFWKGCGENRTFAYFWWECNLVQLLWKWVWWFLKKSKNRSSI